MKIQRVCPMMTFAVATGCRRPADDSNIRRQWQSGNPRCARRTSRPDGLRLHVQSDDHFPLIKTLEQQVTQ